MADQINLKLWELATRKSTEEPKGKVRQKKHKLLQKVNTHIYYGGGKWSDTSPYLLRPPCIIS